MVNLDIQVTGLASVNRAFQQIEARARQLDNRLKAAGSGGARSGAGRKGNEGAKAAKQAAAAEKQRHREAMQHAKREEQARVKAVKKAAAEEKKAIAAAERQQRAVVSGINKSLMSTISGMTKMIAGTAALLGGISAGQAVGERLSATTAATRIANTAYGGEGEHRTREKIRSDVLAKTDSLSKSTGTSQNDLMEMLDNFVAKGGDLKVGEQLMPFMDKVGRVTGAKAGDVGAASSQIMMGLSAAGFKGPELIKLTEEALISFADQAKTGSVEIKDLASQMGSLITASQKFEGSAPALIKTFGVLGQLAIKGGAREGEVGTAVSRLPSDIQMNQKKFDKLLGRKGSVFDSASGKLRDPLALFRDVLVKTQGKQSKLPPGLLGAESKKIFDPLMAAYSEAFKGAGGGKKGEEAGLAAFDDLIKRYNQGALNKGELEASSEFEQTDPAVQAAKAMNDLKSAMADVLVPALVSDVIPALKKAQPAIESALKAFSSMLTFATENPIATAMAVAGAAIAKAGFGTALANLSTSMKTASTGLGGLNTTVVAVGLTMAAAAEKLLDEIDKKKPGFKENVEGAMPWNDEEGNFSITEVAGMANPAVAYDKAKKYVRKMNHANSSLAHGDATVKAMDESKRKKEEVARLQPLVAGQRHLGTDHSPKDEVTAKNSINEVATATTDLVYPFTELKPLVEDLGSTIKKANDAAGSPAPKAPTKQ